MMSTEEAIRRISRDREICGGEPCVKGTRIPVSVVLSHLAAGEDVEKVLGGFPGLAGEDVMACLAYAAATVSGGSIAV